VIVIEWSRSRLGPRRQLDPLQPFNELWRAIVDVEQSSMYAELEVLAGVLALVRRSNDREAVPSGWQWYRSGDTTVGAFGDLHDSADGLIKLSMVVGTHAQAKPHDDPSFGPRRSSCSIEVVWSTGRASARRAPSCSAQAEQEAARRSALVQFSASSHSSLSPRRERVRRYAHDLRVLLAQIDDADRLHRTAQGMRV
jgi:hypothetical protein